MGAYPEYLPELHKTEVEILDEIVRICNKFNLTYYLIGGTLLGAVRHKGFIPWDDDLDIAMPRKDYDKFCQLCTAELDTKYYLHSIDTDPEYWLPFVKIRKKNTLFNEQNIAEIHARKGIFVDIFPLDDAKCETSFEQRVRTKAIKRLASVITMKRGILRGVTVRQKLFLLAMKPFSIATVMKWQRCLMMKQNGKGGDYYINFGSNYNTVKQTILKSKYDPTSRVEFCGKMYDTMNDYTYFLERIYGANYMQLPPVEKRITHRPVCISFDMLADGLKEE